VSSYALRPPITEVGTPLDGLSDNPSKSCFFHGARVLSFPIQQPTQAFQNGFVEVLMRSALPFLSNVLGVNVIVSKKVIGRSFF